MSMAQELPRKRVFKRMLLIFSLTSLFTVSLLLFFIYKYYTNIQLDTNLQRAETIANKQLDALTEKQKALISLTQDIYRNSDLMQDVQIAMTNDYGSYTEQNIDNYFKSKNFLFCRYANVFTVLFFRMMKILSHFSSFRMMGVTLILSRVVIVNGKKPLINMGRKISPPKHRSKGLFIQSKIKLS